jgi:integrase/recombinase XerD
MTSVSIVFRSNKINKKGEAPIHIRITKDRKAKYITTGVMVHEKDWDDSHKKIKSRGKSMELSETIARTNAKIWKQFNDIQNEVLKVDLPKRAISSKAIRETVVGKKPQLFFPFADQYAERIKIDQRIGTYDRVCTVINKLKEYNKEMYFSDINPQFLKNYETYLTKKGNKVNTIHSNFKIIRAIFNEAFRQELIDFELNPFLRYKMKTEKTNRVYLTEEELKAFEKVDVTEDTKMELHKNMFVFASYTGGLRISDVLQLQWKHFDGTHINFKIKKTGEQITIKLPNRALQILEKYMPKDRNTEKFVFDMLPENVYEEGAKALDLALTSATAYINKNLKKIASKAKIEKNVSFHTSRHTWATRALRKGVTIDKVSKLMGHSAIKETQVYAKIVNSELDKAMDAFND